MPIKIMGWEGVCFVPGDNEPDEQGRITIMTTHTSETKPSPEEAWEEAKKLASQHGDQEFIAIRPVTTKVTRPRRLITLAIYE